MNSKLEMALVRCKVEELGQYSLCSRRDFARLVPKTFKGFCLELLSISALPIILFQGEWKRFLLRISYIDVQAKLFFLSLYGLVKPVVAERLLRAIQPKAKPRASREVLMELETKRDDLAIARSKVGKRLRGLQEETEVEREAIATRREELRQAKKRIAGWKRDCSAWESRLAAAARSTQAVVLAERLRWGYLQLASIYADCEALKGAENAEPTRLSDNALAQTPQG